MSTLKMLLSIQPMQPLKIVVLIRAMVCLVICLINRTSPGSNFYLFSPGDIFGIVDDSVFDGSYAQIFFVTQLFQNPNGSKHRLISVADPGFPGGGRKNPQSDGANLLLDHISAKTAKN